MKIIKLQPREGGGGKKNTMAKLTVQSDLFPSNFLYNTYITYTDTYNSAYKVCVDKIQSLQLTCHLKRNFHTIYMHNIGIFTWGWVPVKWGGLRGWDTLEGSGTFLGKGL